MSRLPSASGIAQPKRLSRQPSLDLRRRKQAVDQAPPPVPPLKASKSSRQPSLSRASVSSYDDLESPISPSRYSLSSIGSTQTTLTSPRTSLTSPKPTYRRSAAGAMAQHPIAENPMPASLRVGERVAVDSMGIVGTLRFLGPTQFKEGEWAGIQLDIIGTGKNDGSVAGIRYFTCPPQTGLFVQSSKVVLLNSPDWGSTRSTSPPSPHGQRPASLQLQQPSTGSRIGSGTRAARYATMTAAQLKQRSSVPSTGYKASPVKRASLRSAAGQRLSQQQHAQQMSPTPTRRRSSGQPPLNGNPSSAIAPANHGQLEPNDAEDDRDDLYQDVHMLTDIAVPANLAMSKSTDPALTEPESDHARLERVLGEAIAQAPDEAVMRLQQLQLRVEVLEAENKFLKLENAQNKTAEQILERSVVLAKMKNGGEGVGESYFTLDGHKAIVQEIRQEHETARKTWEKEGEDLRSSIKKLEIRVSELELEQRELIKERDQLQEQLGEARKERAHMEHKILDLENKVAIAEASASAAQASRTASQTTITANFYSQDPEEMRERQMQMEMEMEEVHEKMGSLMEAMRAKDMFLSTLSEQVEQHRSHAEEREREVRRVRADAERHGREKERLREEINEMEKKWEEHRDCVSRREFEKITRDLNQAKESLARETAIVEECRKRIEALEQSEEELKRAGMESIDLYENATELHRVDMEALNAALMDERRTVATLEVERESLRKAGLEAIETYEATIEELKKERTYSNDEHNRQRQELQATIGKLKQEIEQLVNASNKSEEVEEIKAVWESERQRLMAQVEASSQSLAKERELFASTQQEMDTLRGQIKALDKMTKEKASLEEKVRQLQANYEEQLSARSKYLDDVRAAVESQKKTEGELRRLTEAKEKTERDLVVVQESLARTESHLNEMRKHGGDMEAIQLAHAKEMDLLRQEIEKLQAQNAMISKQKEQLELLSASTNQPDKHANEQLQRQVEQLTAQNQKQAEALDKMTEAQKQAETECLKLMDEIEKMHAESPQEKDVPLQGCTDDERVIQLQSRLNDTKRQMERLIVKHNAEIRQLKEKHAAEDSERQREITTLGRDVAELESLIETKIFKEADIEEALEKERRKSSRLQQELGDLKEQVKQLQQQREADPFSRTSSITTSSSYPHSEDGPYCEICEVTGHDLISCKAVLSKEETKQQELFCENCDAYGLHVTLQCPNQNETF